ncbi:MAG: hypothetical protein LQ340_001916 [Diploschistes diacapsis]|nr:MAG: hypothetical protein LQ340_001916 [Diploschistes diacapsis]
MVRLGYLEVAIIVDGQIMKEYPQHQIVDYPDEYGRAMQIVRKYIVAEAGKVFDLQLVSMGDRDPSWYGSSIMYDLFINGKRAVADIHNEPINALIPGVQRNDDCSGMTRSFVFDDASFGE